MGFGFCELDGGVGRFLVGAIRLEDGRKGGRKETGEEFLLILKIIRLVDCSLWLCGCNDWEIKSFFEELIVCLCSSFGKKISLRIPRFV